MKRMASKCWHSCWALSLVSGLLLGLSFPPFPFPFLQFPAFIFLFRLIQLCHTARGAAYYTYFGFLIWNLIATYWLMMASLIAGIAAILANAALMAGVVMLQFQAEKKLRNSWLIALLQAAFWVSFEYFTHHWDMSWPWLSLGNGWSDATPFIQYISYTGFWGISFWVMFSSALVYQAIRHRDKSRWVSAGIGLIIFPVLSFIILPGVRTQPKTGQTVKTIVAQPNFNAYSDLGGASTAQKALDRLVKLTDSVRSSQTELVLWPENAIFPYLSNSRNVDFAATKSKQRVKAKAADWNTTIIGGSAYLEYFSSTDHPALPQRAGQTPYLTYNAAMGFYPNGQTSVYRKHNLVTIVERFPFVHFFNAIDLFGWIDWAGIQGYGQGNRPDQFTVGSTQTPALICYDSVYPGWVRRFVRNGAGFISIITNDGWWGNSSGHIQHFEYARLRAIEFRRWVVQDSNNGTSGVIAPDGAVKKRTAFNTRTAFKYEVPVLTTQTFYTLYGDWLPVGLLVISFGGLVFLLIKRA